MLTEKIRVEINNHKRLGENDGRLYLTKWVKTDFKTDGNLTLFTAVLLPIIKGFENAPSRFGYASSK